MSETKDNFTTPKRTRRLGLRCSSSSILKDHSVKKSFLPVTKNKTKNKSVEIETPVATTSRFVQSDVKINYKNLERSDECKSETVATVNTPGTPKSTIERQAVSTNCRPYRLSLSKRMREKMTKKRLEFHLANEMEKEDKKAENPDENDHFIDASQIDREELLEKIKIIREDIATRQEHAKKVAELKEAINIWKTGFSSALLDLQQRIEPRLDTASLLNQLHIPEDMIKYINY